MVVRVRIPGLNLGNRTFLRNAEGPFYVGICNEVGPVRVGVGLHLAAPEFDADFSVAPAPSAP